ncbi:MAG: ATP-binding cassette domain-containing protein [Oscillospiraceae bacterium]|jgi:oligopeptide/dipeptide ABC transporter ATP-binding protein|nr:ATP-binding cassette domain-containing protein [Oscillospiraceae bacterium]
MSEDRAVMLQVSHLSKLYPVRGARILGPKRCVHAVDDVSFELHAGETLGIVGESGSGKSTLARTLLALTPPTGGSVRYRGEDVTGFRGRAARALRAQVQMVFQDPYASLNPKMKVGEAICEPILVNRRAADRREAAHKARALLALVGLQPDMFDRYPHEFSGGQRQRIGIARALAVEPQVLICDESVSALDVSVQAQILNLFNDLKARLGLTYIFIGHDLAVVRYISDRILVMYLGRVMEIAACDQLFGGGAHPYTQSLVSAALEPTLDQRGERILLQGDIPSPIDPPKGCRFCQRCFCAQGICHDAEPDLSEREPGHFVRCHFAQEVKGRA